MFTSRPKFKNIIGVNYDIDDFGFSLNNTTLVLLNLNKQISVTQDCLQHSKQQVTDLGVTWTALKKLQSLST
jgi:iron complex outermembrane receptor protein